MRPARQRQGNGNNRGPEIATSDVPLREDALTKVIDAMSATDILVGLPKRIHEVIAAHVTARPDHAAFVEDGSVWSYRAFADTVDAVAADFARLKIRPGDRVLLASENSVALAAFVFACSKLDA